MDASFLLVQHQIEHWPLPEEDSLPLASQITLVPLNLFQGRLHSNVTIKMQQMNADVNKRILTLHLMWKMAASIWQSRNQALHGTTKAERDYKKKNIWTARY